MMMMQFSEKSIIEVYSNDDGREKKKNKWIKFPEDREITCCTNQQGYWNAHSIWKVDKNGMKIRKG